MRGRSRINMNERNKLSGEFFCRDVLSVAPDLVGKIIVINSGDNTWKRFMITETEAYRGAEDEACHANKGRTPRTEVMYMQGGRIYVYLVYGLYWMLNFVTSVRDDPQAVLIRSIEGFNGPGRLTKALGIDKSFYGEDLITSQRIWVEDEGFRPVLAKSSRIGIDYAGSVWRNKPWRYFISK